MRTLLAARGWRRVICGILVASSWTVVAQEVPNVIAGTNGEAEAIFSSNNCVVYYRADGTRRDSQPSCRTSQITAADRGVAAYRREQGVESHGSHAPPIVNVGETGYGSVSYHDGCVVNYRQDGHRQNTTGRCSSEQTRQADDAMARYRREQGLDHGTHHGTGAPPEISMSHSTGYGNARFADGCVVTYRPNGDRATKSTRCTDDEARRADDAMARHRREQGMESHGSHGSSDGYGTAGTPRISPLRNGTVQVLYTEPFCTLYFNDKGIRTSSGKDCTRDQQVDAALRIVKYRRDNGL